jgi:LPS-assembly lipoprotein
MSSSDRRTLLLTLTALPLASCGFAPAFGTNGPAEVLLGAVRIDEPGGKDAFDLVERLEERLGRGEAERYALGYAIETRRIGVAVSADGAINRYNLMGAVNFALRDQGTGAQVTAGRVENFTSWSTTASSLATESAEADARRRLMRLLADQIVTRLIATSADWSA